MAPSAEAKRAARRERYQDNREKERAQQRAYHEANPERSRARGLKHKYGITSAEYDAMVESQEGRCKICGEPGDEALHIDHNHNTGDVRGLLCRTCNVGIGHLKDDPELVEAAASYLYGSR